MALTGKERYWQAQAKGLCADCGRIKEDAMACRCLKCQQRRNPRAVFKHHLKRDRQYTAPGPNMILCCGRWQVITQIPLRVPCCGQVYFVESKEQ